MPAHPSFYCHKEIYERYGGFNLSYKIAADFECLLRLIFVHKIRLRYIPMDFVTMRTGGASTSGLSSHKQILRDHQRAFKDNGIYSNVLLESLRYIYKIYEIIETKVSRNNTSQIWYLYEDSFNYRYHRTGWIISCWIAFRKGYDVHGTIRRSSVDYRERIAHLEGHPNFHLHYADLGDSMSILQVVKK